MKPRIVFTGGGTAGHVTPNLSLIAALTEEGWHVDYIGSKESIEQVMIEAIKVPFYSISSGKLRRYFSWENFLDPIRVLRGIVQAYGLLKKLQTNIVFSKGGFVAFPVVVAAWLRGIPIIAHESDLVPGLANRLSFPFINKICLTFEPAAAHFKKTGQTIVTGTPIRESLFQGSVEKGLALCGFNSTKPCILIIGGSLGASKLNEVVREALPVLTKEYQIMHVCGKGKSDSNFNRLNYYQFDYVNEELAHLFAAADLVISRAGANSLYEILALQKAHVLVPLSAKVSRGDQIQNAQFFEGLQISVLVDNDTLSVDSLLNGIHSAMQDKAAIIERIKNLNIQSATQTIVGILKAQLSG